MSKNMPKIHLYKEEKLVFFTLYNLCSNLFIYSSRIIHVLNYDEFMNELGLLTYWANRLEIQNIEENKKKKLIIKH